MLLSSVQSGNVSSVALYGLYKVNELPVPGHCISVISFSVPSNFSSFHCCLFVNSLCLCICVCVKGKDVSYLKHPAAGLVRLALDRWQLRGMRADNVSAIVILLDSSSDNDRLRQSTAIPPRRESIQLTKDVLHRIRRTRNPRRRVGLRTVLGKICRLRAQRNLGVLRSPLGTCNNQPLPSPRDSAVSAKPAADELSEMPIRQLVAVQQFGGDFSTLAKPANNEMSKVSSQVPVCWISAIQQQQDFTTKSKPPNDEVPLKRQPLLRRRSYQEACDDSDDNSVERASLSVRRLAADVCHRHSYKGLTDNTATSYAEGPRTVRDDGIPVDGADVMIVDNNKVLMLSEKELLNHATQSGHIQLLGTNADATSEEVKEEEEEDADVDGVGDEGMKEWDFPCYRSVVDPSGSPTADEP